MSSSIGHELASLNRRVKELEAGARQFKHVAIDGAALPVYDDDGTLRQVIGRQDDGTYTSIDHNGPPPPTPSPPVLVTGLGSLVVVWDGRTSTGDPWPLDFRHVEVHLSAADGFTPTDDTQVGVLSSLRGGALTIGGLTGGFPLWVRMVAVSRSGAESAPTGTETATPEVAADEATLNAIRDDVDAATAAVAAKVSAYYSPTEPAVPAGGFHDSDQWWQLLPDGGYAGWKWDSAANGGAGGWVAYQFGADALVSEVIQARHLVADLIQAEHIAAEAVNTRHLGAEAVTAEQIAVQSLTGDRLAGQLVLGSRISTGVIDDEGQVIGQRTELSPAGFENIAPDGSRNAFLPNDPEATAFLRAALETESLRIKGGLAIESDRNEFARDSATLLAAGVSDPTAAPTLSVDRETVQLDTSTKTGPQDPTYGDMGSFKLDPSQITGVGWHAGLNCWMVSQQRPGGVRLWRFNPNGTLFMTLPAMGATRPWVDDEVGVSDRSGPFGLAGDIGSCYVERVGSYYRASLKAPNGNYVINRIPASAIVNDNQAPYLGYDPINSRFFLAQNNNTGSNDNYVVKFLSPTNTHDGTLSVSSTFTGELGSGRSARIVGATYGQQIGAGTGPSRHVYLPGNGATGLVLNTGGVAVPEERFPVGGMMLGFCHDGSFFWSINASGTLTRYENWTWTDAADTFYAGYTWVDSDPVGGTHETKVGKLGAITASKRSRIKVTIPVVPDKGGQDDPDTARVYVARASAQPGRTGLWLHAQGGSPSIPTTFTISSEPATTGTNPPPDPNPYAFPGANPAVIASAATDASGRRKYQVDGFGRGRWPRMLPPGTVFDWTGGSQPPEGWQFANGAAVSRTQYPELAALYWDGANYRYGNGDGSTTFNLPNIPAGSEAQITSASPVTAASGWSVSTQQFARLGRLASVRFSMTRTGAAISAGAGTGDIANQSIGSVAAAWRPLSLQTSFTIANGPLAAVSLDSSGDLSLNALAPNGTIAQDATLVLTGTYLLGADLSPIQVRKIIYLGEGTN